MALLPAPVALSFSGFGSKTSAGKVAVKSLESQLLGGVFLFYLFFPRLQTGPWNQEGRLPWAVPPKVI